MRFTQGISTTDGKKRVASVGISTVGKEGVEGIPKVSRSGGQGLSEPLIKRQGELEGRFGGERKATSVTAMS